MFTQDKTSLSVTGAVLGFSIGKAKVHISAGAQLPGFGVLDGTITTELEIDGQHHAELEDVSRGCTCRAIRSGIEVLKSHLPTRTNPLCLVSLMFR